MFIANNKKNPNVEPFCDCWRKKLSVKQYVFCDCGEEDAGGMEWNWEEPSGPSPSLVVERSARTVVFHPHYSTGTAAARGDTPFDIGHHYYWEVKLLTEAYGTDIMIGMCSDKADMDKFQYKFNSLLGVDSESYGLSYKGYVCHDGVISREGTGFCRGSVIGVRVDMFLGTMEFFVNRKAQGISFYNLKRHDMLYPIICSTAAYSSMRLIYTDSWPACLLVDAYRLLAKKNKCINVPPGFVVKMPWWLTIPSGEPVRAIRSNAPRPMPLGDEVPTFVQQRPHSTIFTPGPLEVAAGNS